MGLIGVSRNLLVFISVLSLINSTAVATNTTNTTGIFYPFGSAVGDVQTLVNYGGEDSASVNLTSPFIYFGRTYNLIYVNYNGLLSFNQPIIEDPYTFPYNGSQDVIAPLWADFDDYGIIAFYYQQYTSGNVLRRATDDIRRYYPGLSFNASWVFVATWDYVQTSDLNTFLQHSAPSISFQAVLISDGVSSFILMNYGNMSVINYPVEAGYDTIGSTHYFVIPGSNNGNLIPNLTSSSNVNTPGRWVFSTNQASGIFYPFGSAVGDVRTLVNYGGEDFAAVNLARPFVFFGRTYNLIYVNYNGLLSFNQPLQEDPYTFPSFGSPYGNQDVIAPLWADFDEYGIIAFYYQQYTSGNVLTRATEDIKRYYPGLSFNATWVFVTTWDYVETTDLNTFLQHSAPSISFQAVLISDGVSSFTLMNYGNMSVINYPVEAGYDTIGSTHYFVIPGSNNGNLIPNLKYSSNVNTPGRWAFSTNQASGIFYPFGSAVGDVRTLVNYGGEDFAAVNLARPFVFFGRTYSLIYVNYNGLLSFNQPLQEDPYTFPSFGSPYGNQDVIAPLWADFDDYGIIAFYYQQYTSGNVLTRATEDIKRYYPGLSFNATWVFVATWDYVQTTDLNTFLQHSAPSISFQAILISDGVSSFTLMNYGNMSVINYPVEAGYDTIGSTHYFVIPGSNNGNLIPNLKSSSNVNTPGRWAFCTNEGIFYPFGTAVGDNRTLVNYGGEDSASVNLTKPFVYFGRTYNLIYVNYNGLLSFNQPLQEDPYTFPNGGQDLIAPLWADFDDYGIIAFYYQQYTSGNVLTRATEDIKRYYPGLSFNASWVFVATWDYVETWDLNTFLQHSAPSNLFQAVLISDGVSSFILMNYGNMSLINYPVEAGYDTIGSTHYFVIPGSNNGNLIPNLTSSSNVNTPGRWVFSAKQANSTHNVNLTSTARNSTAVPAIFYPFGSAIGDVQTLVPYGGEDSALVNLSRPFVYFGRTYNRIYVNYNGLLSFNQSTIEDPYTFGSPYGSQDVIAPLWADFDDYGIIAFYYQQYTSGNVLTRATEDIKRYYPGLRFNATWVFVATWDYVQTTDLNTFSQHSAPSNLFQAVLISDGVSSFILMNYGNMSVINYPVEAGYDTVGSTHYFVIPGSNIGNFIPYLKSSSNVNTPGRWAFSANQGIVQFSEIFYPVGLAVGDIQTLVNNGGEDSASVYLASPFVYFGRTYNRIYVNYNGLLSFNQPLQEGPYTFPNRSQDVIAPLWADFDDYGIIAFYYQEYRSGNVLTRATEDIKRYYPGLSFRATWVFVATWDFVNTTDLNTFLHHSAPSVSFQAVLISDGVSSFILMNYGDMSVINYPVEAGYDTVGSTNYFVIPWSKNGTFIPFLKNTTNVNVPGRWAFTVNREKVVGLQMKVTSFLNLTDSGNLAFVMQKLKDELVNRGMPLNVRVTARKVQKTKP